LKPGHRLGIFPVCTAASSRQSVPGKTWLRVGLPLQQSGVY
jgi:hypothetical protein